MKAAGGDPEQPRHRGRRVAFRLAAALVGLLLAALTGEVVVRLAGVTAEPRRHFRPGIYREDPELGWTLLPGYRGAHMEHDAAVPTTTNQEGFRGPEWDPARAGAALRVLALGDSCTFGRGVEDGDTWPAQLEARLRARGLDAAAWNAGVMGYDTVAEARLLRRLGPRVRPQVVVVMWLPNDATEPWEEARRASQVIDGQLVNDLEKYLEWKGKIEHRGLHRSALYRFVNTRAKLLRAARFDWSGQVGPEQLAPCLEALGDIARQCRELSARPVLVTLPRQEEVEDPDSSIEHHARVVEAARALGFQALDLAAAWRPGGKVDGRWLADDTVHLTAAGYRDVAEALVELVAPR